MEFYFQSNFVRNSLKRLKQSHWASTVSLNYSKSIKINIGSSDGRTIVPSAYRPTIMYWRLSHFIQASSFFINFMGKNPWKFGQKQCTVHKGLYFLEKELSWSLKLRYTVTVLPHIFFVYYFYATSGELGCRGVRKCQRPCRTWIWLM